MSIYGDAAASDLKLILFEIPTIQTNLESARTVSLAALPLSHWPRLAHHLVSEQALDEDGGVGPTAIAAALVCSACDTAFTHP